MKVFQKNAKINTLAKITIYLIVLVFSTSTVIPPNFAYAQTVLNLPAPGTMVPTTSVYHPLLIKGINIHPENPFQFDFIIETGDSTFERDAYNMEVNKLIKYFLASLTVPEKEMWVNLSPYEKNRIIPDIFGETEMGRDLLAQDYLLKQLTASLMNPEDELGQKFWDRVYAKAQAQFGTTDIPMNTFNKIWIVPEEAVVYEHTKGAVIVKSHLKVLLEEDYIALEANKSNEKRGWDELESDTSKRISGVSSKVVKEVLIPEIEKEVNEGRTFANLRQIFHSMLLAAWYKQTLKQSVVSQVYVDQGKTKGVDVEDNQINQKIYRQYVEAFEKGVYDFIKEDYDPTSEQVIPRKYFAGGVDVSAVTDEAMLVQQGIDNSDRAVLAQQTHRLVSVALQGQRETYSTIDDYALIGVAPGGVYNYPDLSKEEEYRKYYDHLASKAKRYNDSLSYEDFKTGIEKLKKFIDEHPNFIRTVIAVDPDHHYAVIKSLWENANSGKTYMDRTSFDILISELTEDSLQAHPEVVAALFTNYRYPETFQVSTYVSEDNEDTDKNAERLKAKYAPEFGEAFKWSQQQWSEPTEDPKLLRRQKRIYAYLAIRQRQNEENKVARIKGKQMKGFLNKAEKDVFSEQSPVEAIAGLKDINDQDKVEALFVSLLYDVTDKNAKVKQATIDELYNSVLSYGYSEPILQQKFVDADSVSALSGLDQITKDRYRDLQKASRLLDPNQAYRASDVSGGSQIIPNDISKKLEKVRKDVLPILASAGEEVLDEQSVWNFHYMGFEGGYRGTIGEDCTACVDNQAYVALHPANHYYEIERSEKNYGYIGLTEAVIPGQSQFKFLTIDTIQSPDSAIPTKSFPDILKALENMALELGFDGIALPNALEGSFNHTQVQNAIKSIDIYKNGRTIFLETQHQQATDQLEDFGHPSDSMGKELFRIITPLSEEKQSKLTEVLGSALRIYASREPPADVLDDEVGKFTGFIAKKLEMFDAMESWGIDPKQIALAEGDIANVFIDTVIDRRSSFWDLEFSLDMFVHDQDIYYLVKPYFSSEMSIEEYIDSLTQDFLESSSDVKGVLNFYDPTDRTARLVENVTVPYHNKIKSFIAEWLAEYFSQYTTDNYEELDDELEISEGSSNGTAYFAGEVHSYLAKMGKAVTTPEPEPEQQIDTAQVQIEEGATFVSGMTGEEFTLDQDLQLPMEETTPIRIIDSTGVKREEMLIKSFILVPDPDNLGQRITIENLEKRIEDQAMEAKGDQMGGIDLNPAIVNMDVQKQGKGFQLPTINQPSLKYQNIEGFIPIIINVSPTINILPLIGLSPEKEKVQKLSSRNIF